MIKNGLLQTLVHFFETNPHFLWPKSIAELFFYFFMEIYNHIAVLNITVFIIKLFISTLKKKKERPSQPDVFSTVTKHNRTILAIL